MKSWFGLRVIADTKNPGEFQRHPYVAVRSQETGRDRLETLALTGRCKDFSVDWGLNSGPLKAKLKYGPLTRLLWREEKNDAPRTSPARSPTTTPVIPRGAKGWSRNRHPTAHGAASTRTAGREVPSRPGSSLQPRRAQGRAAGCRASESWVQVG